MFKFIAGGFGHIFWNSFRFRIKEMEYTWSQAGNKLRDHKLLPFNSFGVLIKN